MVKLLVRMSDFYPLRIKEINRETANAVSLKFEIPDHLEDVFQYLPGQYLTLRADINGEDIRRCYSLCSAPYEKDWAVAIKRVPEGRFSTFAVESLREGDEVQVMPPLGNFVAKIDENNSKTYVAFAAGSGITPVMSIMKSVLQSEPGSNFILFYGNRNTGSIIFKEEIDQLKNVYMERLSVYHVLSRERIDGDLFNGRLNPEKCSDILKFIPQINEADEYFFCGPGNMVSELKNFFAEQGKPSTMLHAELFTSPDEELKEKLQQLKNSDDRMSGESRISIKLDNHEYHFNLEFDTNNILDAATEAGIDLPFSCKGGVCCTCRAQVVEGDVNMMVNYALEPEEVEEGFVLTCQSYPKSTEVKLDFDA